MYVRNLTYVRTYGDEDDEEEEGYSDPVDASSDISDFALLGKMEHEAELEAYHKAMGTWEAHQQRSWKQSMPHFSKIQSSQQSS